MTSSGVLKPLSSLKVHGGRSSVSGATVTVFGAAGFIGRYVVNRLGKMGCRVVVPYRGDELHVRHLKPMGDLGVINPMAMSIRNLDEIETAVAGSNVVINLLGKHFETSRWSFQDVHASFPGVLGTVCAEQGVDRLIHMSALGASVSSPSSWARSKAVGEENVRAAFPETTILRPAPVFGDEDRLLNRIAKLSRALPVLPLVDGDAKQQPIFCDDLAKAVVGAVTDPASAGQTYALCGPKVYSNKDLCDYVFKAIADDSNAVVLPRSVGMAMAAGVQLLPNPWLTPDQLRMQTVDTTMPAGELGLSDLGVSESVPMEDRADRYLMRFRKISQFVEEREVVRAPQ
jgi:NADH dehydrogenase (ubiquinone) 1 alpha subcomplex subunit 9|eukprot:Transcript_25347.p2 GENE.Transcript_25347~~Transcript_25347.p2  ORF type:complete len:344 (-),score=125.72 Transcript_25347:81-1112(-)